MKKITLQNTFHNTQATIAVKNDKFPHLSRRQYLAAWRKLCGVSGCTCRQGNFVKPKGGVAPFGLTTTDKFGNTCFAF